MSLTPTQINELASTTTATERRDRLTNLVMSNRKFIVLQTLMGQHKITEQGGDEIEFYVRTGYTHSAYYSAMHEVDAVTRGDVPIQTGKVPWRGITAYSTWDLGEPMLNSPDPVRLIRFADLKEEEMQLSLALQCERFFWGKPADSTDTKQPYGVDTWITYPAAYTVDGFVGLNPPGFASGVGNLNSTTWPLWADYYARYVAVSDTDFVAKLIDLEEATDFESLIPNPRIRDNNKGDDKMIAAGWPLIKQFRAVLRNVNDDLGADLAWGDNTAVFHGRSFTKVDFLNNEHSNCSTMAQYNPLYFINWGVMEFVFQAGWDRRRTTTMDPTAHNTVIVFDDNRFNLACTDRRRQGLMSTAI